MKSSIVVYGAYWAPVILGVILILASTPFVLVQMAGWVSLWLGIASLIVRAAGERLGPPR